MDKNSSFIREVLRDSNVSATVNKSDYSQYRDQTVDRDEGMELGEM